METLVQMFASKIQDAMPLFNGVALSYVSVMTLLGWLAIYEVTVLTVVLA